MTLFCRNRGLVVVSLAVVSLGTRAAAQAGYAIGPVVGYYLTLGSEHGNDGPNAPGNFSAPAYGAELTFWSRGRFGVQAQSAIAWASPQNLTVNPGGFTTQEPGHIIVGSLSAMYAFDVGHAQRIWISAGPGFVGYRGLAFESSGSPTETAAALGIGGSRSIDDAFGFAWGASTMLYKYTGILGDIGGPPGFGGTNRNGSIGSRFRSDVLLHFSITLNGHT